MLAFPNGRFSSSAWASAGVVTPAGRRQVGDKVVIDVKIVGKAVHEHEDRPGAVVVAGVDSSLLPRNIVLCESRSAVHGVLDETEFDIGTAAFRRRGSARQGRFDWIIATFAFLKY
jgi:hypothetical protein